MSSSSTRYGISELRAGQKNSDAVSMSSDHQVDHPQRVRGHEHQRERGAHQVGGDHHLAAVEPVDQHAGERAEDERRDDLGDQDAGDRERRTAGERRDERHQEADDEPVADAATNCAYHSRRNCWFFRMPAVRRRVDAGASPPRSTAVASSSAALADLAHAPTSNVAERTAEQPRLTATGSAAMWHGAVDDVHRERRRVAAEPRRADAGRVDRREQLGLERRDARVARRARRSAAAAPSWPGRRPCRTSRRRRRRRAAAGTRRSPWPRPPRAPRAARPRCPAPGGSISTRLALSRAAALEHHVDGRAGARPRAEHDVDEGRRVVAGVGAVEQRVAHDAHAQLGVAVRQRRRRRRSSACRSPQRHSSAPSSIADPDGAGVLAQRHASRASAIAAFSSSCSSTARPRGERSRRGGGLAARRARRGAATPRRAGWRRGPPRRSARRQHASPAGRASRPPRRPSRPRPAAQRARSSLSGSSTTSSTPARPSRAGTLM